ncbi:MqnA/MqnD/SBP family protein [Helicobacter turcicus]|uniref:Chorismate dehydratase n=1 Tax=Helicobacter turcicus TaxID=2867412 RepID=A0ABS7JMF0_9HELI|nr:MqnA/MqnD/SBP family protein [Helicobacter turcicus]MBX7490570.1 menaquinone biosynthesis protein [Helicobacter turcicus]MBX7545520.1 menaquinone biosynthesis protein [Helicobacter turcicus]
MRFGKIDYLNLLPFEVFVRAYPKPSQFQLFYNRKKSYPAHLNKEFLFGRIDAGFVSSITALRAQKEKFKATNVGIIARKRVISVICLPKEQGEDYQSATSNALLKVLGLKGRVLIGDRALVEVLRQEQKHKESGNVFAYLDMGEKWVQKEHLPFVFGRLCVKENRVFYAKLMHAFTKKKVKIPYFMLKNAESKSGVKAKEILNYLKVLSYKMDKKAQFGVERFYRKLRILGIKPPSRF